MASQRWRLLGWRLGAPLAALAAGCAKRSEEPTLGASPVAPALSSASPVGAPSTPPTQKARPLPDGCFVGVPSGAPDVVLGALAERCAREMATLLPEALTGDLAPGGTAEARFAVGDASRCVRAIAAGASSIANLDLAIVDATGRTVAEDELDAPFALAPPRGPLCVDAAGEFRAVVRAKVGHGAFAVQVHQAR